MKFRVRAAAIILNEKNELLLVLHKHPSTYDEWWTFPGGGLEPGESAFDAVIREVKEECHVDCTPNKLVYVREFLDLENDTHHVELFFTAMVQGYEVKTGVDPELEEQFISEVRFLSEHEVRTTRTKVYPEILRNRFWEDLKNGFLAHTVYLGQQR